MLELRSAVTFESKVSPGVQYRLRKMIHSRRVQFNLSTSGISTEISDIYRELEPIEEDIKRAEDAAKIEPCTCNHDVEKGGDVESDCHDSKTGRCSVPKCSCRDPKPDETLGGYAKMYKLQEQMLEIIAYKMYPAYIRWGLHSVQGLKLFDDDDQEVEPTVENYIQYATEDLISEVANEIKKKSRLSSEEVTGFKSPTISDGQMDGQTNDTTAPSASATDSTSPAAASATSPN